MRKKAKIFIKNLALRKLSNHICLNVEKFNHLSIFKIGNSYED